MGALWLVRADVLRRPARALLIALAAGVAVSVLVTLLSLSDATYRILEKYLNAVKPNVILVVGPVLPLSPSQALQLPHVEKVVEFLITDAYLNCTGRYYYVLIIGYPSFEELEGLIDVEVLRGSVEGLAVAEPVEELYGRRCRLELPFAEPLEINVTGVIRAPALEEVLSKSKLAIAPISELGAEPNALALEVPPDKLDAVIEAVYEATGGQAYVISQRSLMRFGQVVMIATKALSLFVGSLTLLIVATFVAVLSYVDVKGRAWEVGLLKAFGFTSRQIALSYLLQSAIYSTAALALGVPASLFLLDLARGHLSSGGARLAMMAEALEPSFSSLLTAVAVTYVLMGVGAALPAAAAYRMEAVEALKEGE
ncbi:MAG: ABC transporter permease [Crenarchaeota archaeon]|nr:ABC transporter permease [Thermoproteota archaeon]